MIGAGMIVDAIKAVAKPVARALDKRGERKHALASVAAKAAAARQQGDIQAQLDKREWEMIALRMQAQSWKDEFVTVIVFSPFIVMLIGSVLAAFGHPELAVAAASMMESIVALDIDYGYVLAATAFAAIGLRFKR